MVMPSGPDPIETLLTVANARHVRAAEADPADDDPAPVHDHLRDAEDARRFLERNGAAIPRGRPPAASLKDLRRLRQAVVTLAERDSLAPARPLLRRAAYRLDEAGRLQTIRSGWQGFVNRLLPALLTMREQRAQLKTCANPACRWLFLDRSKNQARVWCDMAVCGNRAKVKRFLARQRR